MRFLTFSVLVSAAAAALNLTGVSLAGAEFGPCCPGIPDKDFTYPTHAEVDYFKKLGLNVFRVPFRWERLQPTLMGDLDSSNLMKLDDIVSYIGSQGLTAVLDPHNYARYGNDNAQEIIGAAGSGVTTDDFADFWARMAKKYMGNDKVIFALMNEPNTMKTEDWLAGANAAIAAIRRNGFNGLLLVPGNAWTGAHSWAENWYGTANSEVMTGVRDSGNNFAFEVHQYLDSDFSGTNMECQSTTIGSEAMATFTGWARQHGYRAFLGEFAGTNTTTCLSAVTDILTYIETNDDVYVGWTWWAAGPWWGDYMFSIEEGHGQPMKDNLKPFLQ